ncbi:MAG: hypothetical protein HY852_00995 [Bradyrhizobium sp.]|uniref:hypothetical protein n=1 Tax=Bradyrhizobium sp. TaxID=376 RepID=UPI0025C4930D|nr:hypothetical protein [Bradyrhizobium sp.]MBI5260377.1 hypothetical protein [Bradyrhizobium sp.]
MRFFRRELGPVERFENALRDKQAARRKLVERLNAAEAELVAKRAAAERLAVGGASDAQLERAEAKMRAIEDRARTLRADVAELDEQVALTERALAEATAQRGRELLADQIETMIMAIERAAPGFRSAAAALVEAVTKSAASVPEATKFSASVDAVGREILAAADLVCWELRTIAVRTRAGNGNVIAGAPAEPERPADLDTERQLVYSLNPLLWREGSELRRYPAFALVELPKALLPVALQHQHVDHLGARRVQTLMHVHGSAGSQGDLLEDAQFVDLDALAVADDAGARVDVA